MGAIVILLYNLYEFLDDVFPQDTAGVGHV